MAPRLAGRAILLFGRHYNSLRPYHRGLPNLCAVRFGTQCAIRCVTVSSGRILLRPHHDPWPVELPKIAPGEGFVESIAGRASHIAGEACFTSRLLPYAFLRRCRHGGDAGSGALL